MSANTKIIVLKSKELIYTGIFIILGILLVLLMFYMFSPDKKDNNTDTEKSNDVVQTMTEYTSGVYSSNVNLGGSNLEVEVTIEDNTITNVAINNLDEAVAAMYPLLTPSLDEINNKLQTVSSIDDITYSGDNKYTSIILLEAIKKAIEPATVK